PRNPNASGVRAYYGSDESLYECRSPLTHAASTKLPTFIAAAQYENPLLDVYSAELFYRMTELNKPVRFVQMLNHNHSSIVAHFNTGEEILGRAILRFFEDIDHADAAASSFPLQ